MNSVDITGLRSGRLVAVKESHKQGRYWFWECLCDCGRVTLVPNRYMKCNYVSNCGSCASSQRANATYLGAKSVSSEGYEMEVVGFVSRSPSIFKVKFNDEHGAVVDVSAGSFKDGSVANPYHKSVVGVGYYGVGPYVAKQNSKHTLEYEDWISMIKRCYRPTDNNPSYQDKSVHKDWHNFQNFAKWATSQDNFGKVGWDLDKDLIVKGNKVYSAETCVYLPREINSFIKRKNFNGLPLGVDVAHSYDGTPYYRVQAREDGNNICLGGFNDIEDAFTAYKAHKEQLAKKLAEKWKAEIPRIAYEALYDYIVEITD